VAGCSLVTIPTKNKKQKKDTGDAKKIHLKDREKVFNKEKNLFEEFCLLGYNAVYSVESQPTFQRNISPPFSRSKNKPSKKPA
jgi:hypothetical protein